MKSNSEEEFMEVELLPAKVCRLYVQGTCKFGSKCNNLHPEKLSPRVKPKTDHKVSAKVGEACQRCLDRHLVVSSSVANIPHEILTAQQCDKTSRPCGDDPCPECRWFAGEKGNCSLAANISRNDQMFKQMAASETFTLPAFKPRHAPIKNHRKTVKDKDGNPVVEVPQPMPASRVRADWEGPTRDEVLNIPDMLPADVRENPWAYCRYPGQTHQQSRNKIRRAIFDKEEEPSGQAKRKRTADSEDVQSAAQQHGIPSYPVPQIQRPPRDSVRGHATQLVLRWNDDGSIASATAEYPAAQGQPAVDVTWNY